jgi:two-component system OmpR family response regulator
MRILLIEDDTVLGAAVRDQIAGDGQSVDWVTRLDAAGDAMAGATYDLVLLDLMLPDGRGIGFLKALRARGDVTPVIILTALDQVSDRIEGLNAGADDYLVKPFDLRELQARVRALGRRAGPDRSGIIEFGRLTLDPAGRVASCDGAPLSLTRREFSLLEVLMVNRTRVMPKERLFDRIFSLDDEEIGLNAIETYVARLRRKLDGTGVAIRTLRGLGYQLVCVD